MDEIYIYTLSDPISNEIRYCGKTKNINERYKSHLKTGTKSQRRKNNWIKSLKKKDLKPTIEIIDIVNEENWPFWEIYWICQLKCWGFNLVNSTSGGDKGTTGYRHTNETKNKITNFQLNRKLSVEWKSNISKGKMGIKFSDNHIKNLSISHKDKTNKNLEKCIYQIDIKNGQILNEFESITKALLYLNKNIKNGSITRVCKGKLKSTMGYYWCYKNNYNDYIFKEYKNSNQRNILQYDKNGDFIKLYDSVYNASIETKFNRDSISHALNDTISHCGYLWFYEDEFDEKYLKNKLNRIKKEYIVQKINIKTNEIIDIYSSIKDAEQKTNIKHIGCVIRGDRNNAGGFYWKKILTHV